MATSKGHKYTGRLDDEDDLIVLMRKLSDESMRRKWVDKAGDLIMHIRLGWNFIPALLNLLEDLRIV